MDRSEAAGALENEPPYALIRLVGGLLLRDHQAVQGGRIPRTPTWLAEVVDVCLLLLCIAVVLQHLACQRPIISCHVILCFRVPVEQKVPGLGALRWVRTEQRTCGKVTKTGGGSSDMPTGDARMRGKHMQVRTAQQARAGLCLNQ